MRPLLPTNGRQGLLSLNKLWKEAPIGIPVVQVLLTSTDLD